MNDSGGGSEKIRLYLVKPCVDSIKRSKFPSILILPLCNMAILSAYRSASEKF